MASNTSKVFIDIITQFTGIKSIKQAETSFDRLAKSIGRVVSVAAIEEFGRASVKAFLADDAAANQLIKTLDNLGIAFNPTALNDYIQNLQNTTGILDDQLRPAFAQLAVATKDYKTTQDLLNTTLDVSQGTGKSLTAVATALTKAYLGNFASLSRLGAGISKAQIKAGNFSEIIKTLNANFGGDAVAAADTYAGKIKKISAAYTDVKEIIGKGIVDAFTGLVGETGSATEFANSMRDAALYIADIVRGIGLVSAKLKPLATLSQSVTGKSLLENLPVVGEYIQLFNQMGKKKRESGIANDTYSRQKQLLVSQNKSVAATKELVKTGNAQTKAAKDKLLAEKASLLLKTAAKVLDIDQAQILAALSRNLSEDEQNRLKLQQALLNDNADAAGKLAQTILASQQAALLAEKTNPFGTWNDSLQVVLDNLRKMAIELAALGSKVIIPTSEALLVAQDAAAAIADSFDTSFTDQTSAVNDFLGTTTAGAADKPFSWMSGNGLSFTPSASSGATTINLVLDGAVLGTAVTNQQNNSTASGVVVSTTRVNPYIGGI